LKATSFSVNFPETSESSALDLQAEEAIYARADDPMTNWDVEDLRSIFETAGLTVNMEMEIFSTQIQISIPMLARWFGHSLDKPSYGEHLSQIMSVDEIAIAKQTIESQILHKTISWQSSAVFIFGNK